MYIVVLVSILLIFLHGSIVSLGGLSYKGIPSKINSVFGYRTKASMASEEAWQEANRLAGKLGIQLGIVFIVINMLILLVCVILQIGKESLLLAYMPLITFIIEMVIIIVKVETHLKRNFDNKGRRKI